MHINYQSYDILQGLNPSLLETVEKDSSLEVMSMPYTKVLDYNEDVLYEPIDITFYNTAEFSTVGNYYLKHGVYTHHHPIYDKREFDAFWNKEEEKRKTGVTLPCALIQKKSGQWVLQDLHITGEHYGYLNYAPIKRVRAETLLLIEEYILEGKDVSELAEDKVVSLPQFFDSDYYYFKAIELARKVGRHLVVGKARRKGYSYKNGWICANRADLYRDSTTGIAAFTSDTLYPKGTMTMTNDYLQHIGRTTDWAKRRLIDKQETIKFGYKMNDGLGIEYGYKSTIVTASFAPNSPGAIRGKDADVILLEESGKNPILAAVLASTLPTLKAGSIITGLMIVFGTGGGDAKQWDDFEDLFYTPSADGFLAFNNIWDEDGDGTECGFFVPSFMGKEGFIDEHGNSNVKGAVVYENEQRELKRKAKNIKKLTDYIMEEPFNPKEAFSRSNSGLFPVVELEEQLKRVQRDPNIKAINRSGNLVDSKDGVIFKDRLFMTDAELKHYHAPILNYPLKKDDDAHGCFVMSSPPYKSKAIFDPHTGRTIQGQVPANLYRIWHDPFAIPKNTKEVTGRDSLGVFYVYERSNNFTDGLGDRIVATFRGRPDTTDAFNDIMFKAAEFYNAIIMFENDRGDVLNYARKNKKLNRLADEPEVIWKKALQTSKTGRNKGVLINTARKLDGVIYVNDWLIEKRNKINSEEYSLNLHYIYDEALLKELLRFRLDKGNFDGVSTLIVGQYDIKEQFSVAITKPNPPSTQASTHIFDRELY